MLTTVRPNGSHLRRFVLLFALLSLAASLANAAPLCVGSGVGSQLDQYIINYNTFANACQIGDKLFWGFNLANGPLAIGAESPADAINVTPIPGDGLTLIGISFTSGWQVSNLIPIDQIISYNVATVSGQALIKDATLTIVGTLAGAGATGTVVETLAPPVPGSPITVSLPNTVSVNINFIGNEVSGLAVSNRLTLVGGPGNGDSAHISVIENDFSENIVVPEPMTTITLGAGLLLFGMAGRKRLTRTSSKGNGK
jgi:hypothetical protein